MLRSNLCDKSDAQMPVREIVILTVQRVNADLQIQTGRKIDFIFRNQASFTNCIKDINNTYIDSAK